MAKQENESIEWIEKLVDELENLPPPQIPKEDEEAYVALWKDHVMRVREILAKVDTSELTGWRWRWVEWHKMIVEVDLTFEDVVQEINSAAKGQLYDRKESAPWLVEIQDRLAKSTAASLNDNDYKRRPALAFGGMVGHEYAYWISSDRPTLRGNQTVPGFEAAAVMLKLMELRKIQRLEWVKKAVATAQEQPLAISRQFFRGYSLALQKGTIGPAGLPVGSSGPTQVYMVLSFYAAFVPCLESVRELHEWLRTQLPRQLVGTQKRVEKICQSIGLTFRSPGRPRKTENSAPPHAQ